jgi:preprotein translocase subunit SecF
MTATTVMLALIALVAFGGQVIRSFSLAMIWGIFVATYSSIFICSPMLIYLGLRNEEGDKAAASHEVASKDSQTRDGQSGLESAEKEPPTTSAPAKKKSAQSRKPRQA